MNEGTIAYNPDGSRLDQTFKRKNPKNHKKPKTNPLLPPKKKPPTLVTA
jgi:hypothetical protein